MYIMLNRILYAKNTPLLPPAINYTGFTADAAHNRVAFVVNMNYCGYLLLCRHWLPK